ncbi:MAG: SnoaL-like domain-containing protein [Saprospiraceae bacterium]
MHLTNLLTEMDALVSKGQIVEAVDKFFAQTAQTLDFDGTITTTKAQMIDKMTGFVSAIKSVNGIKLHQSFHNGGVSMSEYTFDFDMKDGSQVLWHEIIRREWADGKVINEQYFKN